MIIKSKNSFTPCHYLTGNSIISVTEGPWSVVGRGGVIKSAVQGTPSGVTGIIRLRFRSTGITNRAGAGNT